MRLARAGLVLLAVAVVTSCASPEPPGNARPTGAAASGDATAGPPRITLPLDPYQVSDDDFATVSRALTELTDRCMRRQGLTYEAPAPQDTATAGPAGHERRYGITVLESARTHGYHLAGTPARHPEQPKRSKAYERALTGTGKPLDDAEFDDGCTGEAHRELEAGIDMEAVDLPQWYKRDSFQRSLDDPRVKAVFAAWSRCMAEAGHRYATPLDPPAVRDGSCGLRVIPLSGESVTPFQPNSGVVVLPRNTAPRSRSRATDGASSSHRPAGSTVREPFRVQRPELLAPPPPLLGGGRPLQRLLGEQPHERVHLGLDLLGPAQRGAGHLHGAELALAVAVDEPGRGQFGELGHPHSLGRRQ